MSYNTILAHWWCHLTAGLTQLKCIQSLEDLLWNVQNFWSISLLLLQHRYREVHSCGFMSDVHLVDLKCLWHWIHQSATRCAVEAEICCNSAVVQHRVKTYLKRKASMSKVHQNVSFFMVLNCMIYGLPPIINQYIDWWYFFKNMSYVSADVTQMFIFWIIECDGPEQVWYDLHSNLL